MCIQLEETKQSKLKKDKNHMISPKKKEKQSNYREVPRITVVIFPEKEREEGRTRQEWPKSTRLQVDRRNVH